MNKSNIPAATRQKLYDIVWDYTVGNGDDSEYSRNDFVELEKRWGLEFTPEEEQFIKTTWRQCQMEMANP